MTSGDSSRPALANVGAHRVAFPLLGGPGGPSGRGCEAVPPRDHVRPPARAISTPLRSPRRWPASRGRHRAVRPVRGSVALAGFLAAGVALTWPRASYLSGRLPATRDAAGYVWGFWWLAHQVVRLGDPWHTTYQAAPVGTQLAFHTLMPLPGLLLTPVTLAFGPSASYNLLSAVCPGLLAYAMYRVARLWLPGHAGPVAAGCLFGFSPELCWCSWYQVNLAIGAVFFPLALEASVRLRRTGSARWAAGLGGVVAAAMLTDQESAVMTVMLAALALLPWLLSRAPDWPRRLWLAALAGAASAVCASPQILAMAQQAASGDAGAPPRVIARFYNPSGVGLAQMFAPSPRLADFGLAGLTSLYYGGRPLRTLAGYGVVVSVLGLAGLAVAWRRRPARELALLWLGGTVLALGSAPWLLSRDYRPFGVRLDGVLMSGLMPYTWLVRLPGMADFREAARFTEVGLIGAALLAGAAVSWLRCHSRPVLVAVVACGLLELGWSGSLRIQGTPGGVMPTALPAVAGPIAADHSRSIVVAVPFGVRGGLPVLGGAYPPETLVLATEDGHPLADTFVSRIPAATLSGIERRPFYAGLMRAEGGARRNTPALLRAARRDARGMNVGWVLDWMRNEAVVRYLRQTGFRFAYRADGVRVYRRAAVTAPGERRPGRSAAILAAPLWSNRGHRSTRPLARGRTGPLRSTRGPA